MGKKNQSWCWRKGNRIFYSVPGVKGAYAADLLFLQDIRVNNPDRKKFRLPPRSFRLYVSNRKAIKILESKGWKWERIERND